MKISIVTPSYNQGQYIEQTIDSILSQDFPNKELIVVDGGSTDNSVEIIKKYEKHLAWWVSEKDRGQTHAINKGLAKVTGDVFNWINSDDYLESGALEAVARAFRSKPSTQVACGFTHCFYDGTGETSHTYQMGLGQTSTDTLLNIVMSQPATFYKTDVVKNLGGVNESLHYAFDDELWMKYLAKHGQDHVFKIDKVLAHFRLHETSKSVTGLDTKFLPERMAAYTQIARQAKLPDFIVSKLESEAFRGYVSKEWEVDQLDKGKFISHFASKYQYTFYKDFDYEAASYCLKKTLAYGDWEWSSRYISLFVKLFLLNRRILNRLRKK
jgi:glycosyltransferase involved in cell wall biosynthesis